MNNPMPQASYEGNWYDVAKIDYEYEIVHIKTGSGTARIHFCYIDEIRNRAS